MSRLAILSLPIALLAADWTQFRGPNGSGISSSKGLPERFDAKTNLVWRTPLPPGHSSPVFGNDRIFVTAYDKRKLFTICLDLATGKELWRREAPRDREEPMQPTNSPASPTPVTDGSNVFVFFGDFGLLSYGPDGNERWRMPLGPFNNANGHGSSPILADGKLVLICDQDTGSFLIAVNPSNGALVWKTQRPEFTRGYATAAVYRPKTGRVELIVPGSFQIASYALDTGEKLWWVTGLAWQFKSVPVIDRDRIYVNGWEVGGDEDRRNKVPEFAEALAQWDRNHDGKLSRNEQPPSSPFNWFSENDLNQDDFIDAREWSFYQARNGAENCLIAIRAGGRGDVTKSRVLWRYRKALPNTPSPLLYQGVMYLVRDGILTTLDPETGAVEKQARLTGALGNYWSSPVAADGRILVASEEGKIVVVQAGAQWEIAVVNDLGEDIFATPAIVDGRIYVRTRAALYCFGKKSR